MEPHSAGKDIRHSVLVSAFALERNTPPICVSMAQKRITIVTAPMHQTIIACAPLLGLHFSRLPLKIWSAPELDEPVIAVDICQSCQADCRAYEASRDRAYACLCWRPVFDVQLHKFEGSCSHHAGPECGNDQLEGQCHRAFEEDRQRSKVFPYGLSEISGLAGMWRRARPWAATSFR